LNVSGPKEEKVLNLCEDLEEKGFTILELFNLLQKNGLSHYMKSVVPKELYDKATSHMPAELNVDELKIPNIPYEDLKVCCNGFSESLGRGGFGEVFKGKWREQPIAAKKIENTSFFVEMKVSHLYGAAENILQLLAFSYNQEEGAISCLVYPYMENGSVFSNLLNGRLTWHQRANIAWGTARGLAYLHSQDISHGDIKSNNILLDKHLEPRIGDCGLAMGLDPSKTSRLVDQARGTHIYMPPEFYRDYRLSLKTDVFSYGIFLFELISGVCPLQRDNGKAFEDMKNKMVEAEVNASNPQLTKPPMIDQNVTQGNVNWSSPLFLCGKICVPFDYHDRPTMKTVMDLGHWKLLSVSQPTN